MSFQPEIVDDELSQLIEDIVVRVKPEIIIEIGSADGRGSTQAFLRGRKRAGLENKCAMYCLEMIPERHAELVKNAGGEPLVVCENVSSVDASDFMTEVEIEHFIKVHPELGIASIGAETVKGWLRRDLIMLEHLGLEQDWLLKFCLYGRLRAHKTIVLIDGSPFTVLAEYWMVRDADIIIMDDTMDIKCWDAYQDAKASGVYKMTAENKKLRNGYAVFERDE